MESKVKKPFEIKNIIGIMSGKGGVGKSTVAYLVAKALKLKGHTVGIMDADITGPSIPGLLHLKRGGVKAVDNLLIPDTRDGIKVISMNLLVEREDQPIIWRGPLLSKAVTELWENTMWGDLDFLIIDMPPGTSDIALTVMQSIPLNGLIIVTTPNKLVSSIVVKSINMAKTVKVPVWGLIENMSYIICPNCKERINFFGETALEDLGLKVLARIPLLKEISDIPEKDLTHTEEISKLLNTMSENILDKANK